MSSFGAGQTAKRALFEQYAISGVFVVLEQYCALSNTHLPLKSIVFVIFGKSV